MKVHFIGIGGIGVSALAQYYLSGGHSVSGSDLASSEITDLLKKKGAKLLLGEHKEENLADDVDLVVYSPAVREDNPELKKSYKLQITNYGLQILSYPQALGELTKKYFTIAVSGTHGKSTTASMISLVLNEAGLDPTVIVGTKLKEFGNTNFRLGKSKYLVIEADEWQMSFLNYWPKIIVLNNIEEEHMDSYKNLDHILETYKEYISHLPQDGFLVANQEDENTKKIISNVRFSIKKFSIKQKEAETIREILQIPGEHNVYNGLAVLTVARVLKIPDETALKALSQYKGSWRRFEIIKAKSGNKDITIISDYGHHPTEVKATLKAVREKYPDKKIWCVYQPHQHQRTFYLFDKFVEVFSSAPIDNIIITDIYDVAGREKGEISVQISSQKLVEKVNRPNVVYLEKNNLPDYFKKELENGDILVIMGAGDIYKLVEEFSTSHS